MLVLDTQGRIDHAQAAAREGAAASRQQQLDDEIRSNTISVGDDAGRNTGEILNQLGRPLTSQEVIKRLKLCNSGLIFERSASTPSLYGIYVERWEHSVTGTWEKRKIHVCGMEAGIMPEFSVLHKTKKQVANPELFGSHTPTRDIGWKEVDTFLQETRGWRTVLIRLLKMNLITRINVEQHFGWAPTYQSEKWHKFTEGT